jgi:outer membrane lipoprotein SlyB
LRSVSVNGTTYLVVSEEVKRTGGLGRNEQTAKTVGSGAALGTLIGAVAGGGKGAVLGGLVGAAAGAAVQVMTQGKEVRVPAETVLRFELDEPIQLQIR